MRNSTPGTESTNPACAGRWSSRTPTIDVPIPFCASAVNALINAWTGQLNVARRQMAAVRDRCVEWGAENHLMVVTGYCTLIEIWRGDFAEAALLAEDSFERAEQVGGSRAIALTVRAAVAAYAGREQEARADAAAALRIAEVCHSPRLAEWPTMSLGFLEVSLGRYAEALTTLQPMLDAFDSLPGTEIMTATFIPDAVEAMVALGRHADAEPLIEALERNGNRLSRHWMIAVGARCRSMCAGRARRCHRGRLLNSRRFGRAPEGADALRMRPDPIGVRPA